MSIYVKYLSFITDIEIIEILICLIAMFGIIKKIRTVRRDRKKGLRRIFFPFIGQTSFALIIFIGSLLGLIIGIRYLGLKLSQIFTNNIFSNQGLILTLSLMIWLLLIKATLRSFLVSVPAFIGLVTESLLGGEYFTYPAGIHIRYPWEVVKIENYFSLELITVPFQEDFVSSDGGVVRVKGSFRYMADFDNLIQYAQIAESTIVIGFSNLAKRLITSEIANRSADQARKETDKIKKVIEQLYIEEDGAPKLTSKDEKSFGVQFKDFTLADIGYDKETQNILTTDFNRNVLARATGFNDLNEKAREDALVLEGKITKDIKKIDITGLEGLSGGVKAIVAALEVFSSKSKSNGKDKKKGGGK